MAVLLTLKGTSVLVGGWFGGWGKGCPHKNIPMICPGAAAVSSTDCIKQMQNSSGEISSISNSDRIVSVSLGGLFRFKGFFTIRAIN